MRDKMLRIGCLVFLGVMIGCGELQTEFGRSTGNSGRKSIAGFGVLREFYRREGWNDRTVTRLSERLNNVDTIIWTPDSDLPPSVEATAWFEQWLARGDKTLIYVLKDHQTEYRYWQRAARLAPPVQRFEYRRRVARSGIDLDRALLSRPTTITNGWFVATPLSPPGSLGRLSDPDGDEPLAAEISDLDKLVPFEIEYDVRSFDRTRDQAAASSVVPPPMNFATYAATATNVDFQTVLRTESEQPLISKVTNQNWPDSEIFVVASGSLLTNFGLVDPRSRKIAEYLIANSSTSDDSARPKVGFLSSDETGVSVSSLDPVNSGPNGMELFTLWPINLVTIHAAVLGLLVCLMLLPIFGRPRRLPERPSADFADHIAAVAGLMERTGGEQYARVRISEYMVRVRGETEDPWVLKE
jgi:hypothetical protein